MTIAARRKSARRSFLMAPGDRADLLAKQATADSDAVIICVEDAVLPERKAEARKIVAHALRTHHYGRKERFVRINALDTEFWLQDLEALCAEAPPDGFIMTKVRSPEDVRVVARVLDNLERRHGIESGSRMISCYIETAEAMRYVYEIAAAHPRMANIHFGAEDYTHSIDAIRTPGQVEVIYAMSRIVSAARAAGIEPINVMHIVVHDLDGLRETSIYARQLGFTGRSCPTPRHVPILHEIFSPSEKDVAHARRVVDGFKQAQRDHSGVYMVGDNMTDGPMIKKAMRVLDRAGVEY